MDGNRRPADTRRTIIPRADGKRESVALLVCSVPGCVACPEGSYCRAFNRLHRAELEAKERREEQAAWHAAFQPEVRDVFRFAWTVIMFFTALGLAVGALAAVYN